MGLQSAETNQSLTWPSYQQYIGTALAEIQTKWKFCVKAQSYFHKSYYNFELTASGLSPIPALGALSQ